MPFVAVLIQTTVGLVLLFVGARWLVHGGARLAAAFGAPTQAFAPLVLVLAPAAPLAATIGAAAFRREDELAAGAVVGGELASLLLVVGVIAIGDFKGAAAQRRSGLALLAAIVVLDVFAADGVLVWQEGGVFLLGLTAYIAQLSWSGYDQSAGVVGFRAPLRSANGGLAVVVVLGGIAALALGSLVFVEGVGLFGRTTDSSPVALGASMLAVGAVLVGPGALLWGRLDARLTQSIGPLDVTVVSVLANVAIIGLWTPFQIARDVMRFDIWAMSIATVVVLLMLIGGPRPGRIEGCGLLFVYGAYVATLVEPFYSTIR